MRVANYSLTDDQQREIINEILRLKSETFLFSGLVGNQEIVRSAFDGLFDGGAESFRALSRTAIDAVKRGQLRQNPRYLEAFQEAFSGDAAQKAGVGTNDDKVISILIDRRLDCTVENIRALISEFWNWMADNPQYTQQETVRKQRAHKIETMTNGGTRGFTVEFAGCRTAYNSDGTKHDPMQGQAQGLSMGLKGAWSRGAGSKSFEQMTNEEVDAIYQAFCAGRDMRSMSKEDLKKVVKDGGRTNLFGRDTHPDVAPAQDDRLHHPVTNEAFGQRSLIKYINEAPYNGRNLISRNGRVVPRLRQLFEQTIRGELG